MNFKSNKLRDAVIIALVATGATGAVQAQETETTGATNLDRIQVTGSRIRSVDTETQQPVLVISRDTIEHSGVTNVGQLLQNISANNGFSMNAQVNNGGDGSSGVNLRGLGAARTLVLVNGRRWVSALDASVDLNTIPIAAVERVEVLKDGASSIYGSDAIGGVVNLITRKDYEGAEARVYVGQMGPGDGQQQAYDFTLGANSDRGNILFSASYSKDDAVMARDRAISRNPTFGLTQRSSVSSSGVIWQPVDAAGNAIWPEQFTNEDDYYAALDNVDMSVINNGADSRDLANYHPYTTAGDGYNYASDNYLLTPSERRSLFVQGAFDITDSVTFRSEALYNQRESEQALAGFPVTEGFYLAGTRGLDKDSYFNPYKGTAQARDLDYGRRFTEQPRIYNQDVKTFHFYGGLEGVFNFGDRAFNWDAGYRYSRTDQNDRMRGDLNTLNLNAATGPSFMDTDGVIKCGAPGAIVAGCIPINPLSTAGSINQEQLDYVMFTAHDQYQNLSKSFTANLAGDLFQLPGGMAGFALGFENRKESGYDDPDALVAAGYTSGNARKATAGAYTLDDAFLELALPLLSDLPGAQLLELSAATRFSDYSNFGQTTNSKFGFKWKPINDLMVRGNWSEGFRAPSITNLYRGNSDSYINFGDPCSSDWSGYTADVQARCVAGGVSPTFVQQTNAGLGYGGQTIFPFTLGGNPDLGPETATNYTLGFVYSPSYLQGFDIALDWYKIKIENAISTPSSDFILDQCYVAPDGDRSYCDSSYFVRDGAGRITNMFLLPRNLAEREVEGFDLSVRYRLPDTAWGSFSFNWDSAYVSSDKSRANKDAEWENAVGIYTQDTPGWRLSSNLTTDWTLGDFGVTWTMRYRSSLSESCIGTSAAYLAAGLCSDPDKVGLAGQPDPRNHIESVLYHDVEGRYNLPWNATVAIGGRNVFKKDPPLAGRAFANTYDYSYDTPGGYYYMRYTQRF